MFWVALCSGVTGMILGGFLTYWRLIEQIQTKNKLAGKRIAILMSEYYSSNSASNCFLKMKKQIYKAGGVMFGRGRISPEYIIPSIVDNPQPVDLAISGEITTFYDGRDFPASLNLTIHDGHGRVVGCFVDNNSVKSPIPLEQRLVNRLHEITANLDQQRLIDNPRAH